MKYSVARLQVLSNQIPHRAMVYFVEESATKALPLGEIAKAGYEIESTFTQDGSTYLLLSETNFHSGN